MGPGKPDPASARISDDADDTTLARAGRYQSWSPPQDAVENHRRGWHRRRCCFEAGSRAIQTSRLRLGCRRVGRAQRRGDRAVPEGTHRWPRLICGGGAVLSDRRLRHPLRSCRWAEEDDRRARRAPGPPHASRRTRTAAGSCGSRRRRGHVVRSQLHAHSGVSERHGFRRAGVRGCRVACGRLAGQQARPAQPQRNADHRHHRCRGGAGACRSIRITALPLT